MVNKVLAMGISDMDPERKETIKNLIKELVRREKNVAEVMQVRRRKRKRKKQVIAQKTKQNGNNSANQQTTRSHPKVNPKFRMIKDLKSENFTERKAVTVHTQVKSHKTKNLSNDIDNVEDFFLSVKAKQKEAKPKQTDHLKTTPNLAKEVLLRVVSANRVTRKETPSARDSGSDVKRLSRSRPKKPPILSRDNSMNRRNRSISYSSGEGNGERLQREHQTTDTFQFSNQAKPDNQQPANPTQPNRTHIKRENLLSLEGQTLKSETINSKPKDQNITSESESEERILIGEHSDSEQPSDSLIKSINMEVRHLTAEETVKMTNDGMGLRFSLLSQEHSALAQSNATLEQSGGAILIQGLESSIVSNGVDSLTDNNIDSKALRKSDLLNQQKDKIQIVDVLEDPYDMNPPPEIIERLANPFVKPFPTNRHKPNTDRGNDYLTGLGSRPSQRITFGPKCTLESITGISQPVPDPDRNSDIKSSIFSFRNLIMLSNDSNEYSGENSQPRSRQNSGQPLFSKSCAPLILPGETGTRHKATKSSEFKRRRKKRKEDHQRLTSLDLRTEQVNQGDTENDVHVVVVSDTDVKISDLKEDQIDKDTAVKADESTGQAPELLESKLTLKKETSGGKMLKRSSDLADSNVDYNYSDENSLSPKS